MENFRLHDSARTYGSNHLTINLSVTALKGLFPVFLMMIFMGIGTDVLGQERNAYTGTAIFTQDQLNTFDGAPKTGEVRELSFGDYITLSSSSPNVQATLNDNKGTKVRLTGAFTITAKEGTTITSITLITDRKDRKLDSSVSCTETTDDTRTNRTYTFSNATGNITFTNNSTGTSAGNIKVSSITVNYTYTAAATQTQLVGTFANNIIGYEGDKGSAIPTLTVTAGTKTLDPSEYTVKYSSSNPTAIEISDGKINLNAPSEAVITATITPTNTNLYSACTATFIVSAKALMDLSVDVKDVYMFTNDENPSMPVVNVDALISTGTQRLTAGTDYSYKYALKTDGKNLTISNDGKTITVEGSSRNYTAGNNVITVTVTPTESCKAQYHCKEASYDFTFNVTKAGEKTKPIIEFVDSAVLNTNVKDRKLNARITANGEDITDYFDITYTTTENSIITINGNKLFTFTSTGKATMTITATPKPAFSEQYETATKDVTITVKALKTLTVTPSTIEAQNLQTGQTYQIPELVVKVEENGTLLDPDDDYVVTYISSSANVATIDKEGIVTAFDEGTTTITIHISDVITDPAKKNYEYTEISFIVNVTDPTVFKVPNNQTGYLAGKVLSTKDKKLYVTLGGWMFNKKDFTINDYGTAKETFGDTKKQYWGKDTLGTTGTSSFSPESFKYLIAAGTMKNPRNEFANNCQPQSINVYDKTLTKKDATLIDPMFNVPTSGSYLIFEPKTNGTVTATVMQNGVFDYASNEPVYRPQRRVFVLDEAGTLIQSTPKLEVTSGKFEKGQNDFTQYHWDIQYMNASKELLKAHFGIENFQSDDTNFANEVRECLVDNDIIHNSAVTQGATFKGAKGWSVMVPAPVTYTFNVKAGKTYYLYNFGSRIGLFGFSMKESNPIVDDVTYKEKENNTVNATADGHVAQVSLDRKFAVGKWNSAVLPFSLNKQQVDAIFGQTYDKNHEKGTQILYFEKTDSKYVYYTRHAYNTIVAGKPFLIKPCGKDANGNNVVTREGDNIVLNTEKITAFPYVTIENIEPAKWGRDTETADYYWHSAYNVETVNPDDYYFNGEGSLVMREGSPAKIQAFRGFLKKKTTAQAKLFSVAYFDQLSDNSDIPSKIEGVMMDSNGQLLDFKADDVVYNLSGQVVTTDASSLYSLPKGIYIVNGKKYVVE